MKNQPSRAISIAPTVITYRQVHELESRGLERPEATSYVHRDGRQSGRRDGVGHRHARPSGRRSIAAPNRRSRPRRATRCCPCMSCIGSMRGIRRGTCMGGDRFHCRRRPGLPLSSSSSIGLFRFLIPMWAYVGINTDKRYTPSRHPKPQS